MLGWLRAQGRTDGCPVMCEAESVPPTGDLFDGPVSLMLAKTPDTIPRPGPGGDLAFEPNWDGTW